MPPASPTSAFLDFRRNLDYAKQIVQSARLLSELRVGSLDVDDLFRAAWVQAVAALDHWVHEEIYHRAVIIAQQQGTNKPRRFMAFEIPMELYDTLSSGTVPMDVAFRSCLKKVLGHRSFQNPAKIKEGLALVTDVQLWDEVARILSAETADGTLVTARNVTDEFTRIANRRNRISHEADRDPERPGDKTPIAAHEVEEVIDWLERAVAAILLALGDLDESTLASGGRQSTMIRIAEDERAQRFETLLDEHQTEAAAVRLLLDHWTNFGGWISYGDRDETSCFPIISGESADYWAIAIYPITGNIYVMFEYLSRRPPFDDLELRQQLRDRLNEIPGVILQEDTLARRPSFPIAALHGQGAARLWDALEWFAGQVPRE